MVVAERKHRLPSVQTIEEAERALADAQMACERIEWPVTAAGDSGDAGEGMEELPTSANIGQLYLFSYYLRLRSEELEEISRKIQAELPALAEMAENAELAAGKGGAATPDA